MANIDTLIEALQLCILMPEHGAYCHKCPYASLDDCASELTEDTITALKRLKFLEKPTPEEQPELPGISKKPHKNFIDFLKGKEHCSQESSWTCLSCPYKNEVAEWHGTKSCCFALREDEEYYISKSKEEEPELPDILSAIPEQKLIASIENSQNVDRTETKVIKRWECNGFPCVIIEINTHEPIRLPKWYCGYIGIPFGHVLYQKEYDDINEFYQFSNGQCLTYSEEFLYGQDDKDIWWVGFDHAHVNDYLYPKDLDYVVKECEEFAGKL